MRNKNANTKKQGPAKSRRKIKSSQSSRNLKNIEASRSQVGKANGRAKSSENELKTENHSAGELGKAAVKSSNKGENPKLVSGASKVQLITITEKNDTQRIDNFLLSFLKGVPKSKIYRVIRKGEVRINKKRCKPESRLSINDVVRIPPVSYSDKPKGGFVGDQLLELVEKAILFEDEQLLVVNKPSGLAVHGGSGVNVGLIEVLRKRAGEHQFLELVHRLDRDTSGCILIAKKRSILKHLHEEFREDRVNKIYHMAVFGKWPKHKIKVDAPLKKNELKSGERIVVVHQDGKASQTLFKVLAQNTQFSLVQAKPVTGRTHQIRVHASFSGFPIVGDKKYIPSTIENLKGTEKARLMLHAFEIHFAMPGGKKLSFNAPYEPAYSSVLEAMALPANLS